MLRKPVLGCQGQGWLQIWGSCDCPNLWKVSEGASRFMLQLSSQERTEEDTRGNRDEQDNREGDWKERRSCNVDE